MEGKDSEGRTSASAVESIDAKNGDKHQVDDDTEDEKRFDEDALPVPLEEVEMLTGGVDENDDRTVEFPWDEEARKARVAPRPIKFDGKNIFLPTTCRRSSLKAAEAEPFDNAILSGCNIIQFTLANCLNITR